MVTRRSILKARTKCTDGFILQICKLLPFPLSREFAASNISKVFQMSSYQAEHNISGESTPQNENRQSNNERGRRHITLSDAIEQFISGRNGQYTFGDDSREDRDMRQQMIESLFSYVAPERSDNIDNNATTGSMSVNGSLFHNMMQSLLSSPNTMLVFGDGDYDGKKAGGVDTNFVDTLDRVAISELPTDARCPICTNEFRNDKYPLIVRLPCDSRHCFDLECISPWLKLNRTCPLCREDVTTVRKRKLEKLVKQAQLSTPEEENTDDWMMYG